MPCMAADVRRTWMIRIWWCRSYTARQENRANTVNRVVGGSMANRGAEEQMGSRAAKGEYGGVGEEGLYPCDW